MQEDFASEMADKVRFAEKEVIRRWTNREFTEEEDITTSLAMAIGHVLEYSEQVKVRTKVFTRKGSGSEESITGADLAVFLVFNETEIRKVFLAQAKKNNATPTLKFVKQCELLLKISSDSFIFEYSPKKFSVYPAYNVFTGVMFKKTLGNFFYNFFSCFIGDHHILSKLEKLHISHPKDIDFLMQNCAETNLVVFLNGKEEKHPERTMKTKG